MFSRLEMTNMTSLSVLYSSSLTPLLFALVDPFTLISQKSIYTPLFYFILVISLLRDFARPSMSPFVWLLYIFSCTREKPALLVTIWLSMPTHAYVKEPTVLDTNLSESWFSRQHVSKSCWLKREALCLAVKRLQRAVMLLSEYLSLWWHFHKYSQRLSLVLWLKCASHTVRFTQ